MPIGDYQSLMLPTLQALADGFTKSARDCVARSPKRIVLMDGEELARLMVQHGIGVRTRDRFEVKRIDLDYFDEAGL